MRFLLLFSVLFQGFFDLVQGFLQLSMFFVILFVFLSGGWVAFVDLLLRRYLVTYYWVVFEVQIC